LDGENIYSVKTLIDIYKDELHVKKMGLLKDLIKGVSEDKKELKVKFKEAQQNQKVQRMLEEREKSSNERELERYFKEKREQDIKEKLDKIHAKQSQDNWKGKMIFKGHKSILTEDKKILASDSPILQKSMFFGRGNFI